MSPKFRFPRSTVFLMSLIFGMVMFTIEKANTIQVKYGAVAGSTWPSLPWFLAETLVIICGVVLLVWGILFAVGRSGIHRLAKLEPGRQGTD